MTDLRQIGHTFAITGLVFCLSAAFATLPLDLQVSANFAAGIAAVAAGIVLPVVQRLRFD